MVYYISKQRHKETIVFLHAAFADHTQYDSQVAFFKENYTVITVDLIGHGNSTDVNKGDGIEKTAEYLRNILKEESIQKVHLLGISIGAVLIQDFPNKYPDLISSLICFGGYDINNFDPAIQKVNAKAQVLMMIKALFSIKWFAKSNKIISAYTDEGQEKFYRMNIRFPKKSFMYLAGLNGLVNKYKTDTRNYPIMIGCGDKDIPIQLQVLKKWQEMEPQSEVVIFKNSGHLVNLDAPNEFNETIFYFINRDKQSSPQ